MVDIDIDVDDSAAQRKLEAMSLRARNFRPVFWYARAELEAANAANFDSHGLPVGGWAPRRLGRHAYAWPIMRRTGRLFTSLASLRGAPNDIGHTSATFGTNVSYAHFHQTGTRFMPKRQVVFEPQGFSERVGRVAARYIVDGTVPD